VDVKVPFVPVFPGKVPVMRVLKACVPVSRTKFVSGRQMSRIFPGHINKRFYTKLRKFGIHTEGKNVYKYNRKTTFRGGLRERNWKPTGSYVDW
jgi:hypothetical protein